MKGTRARVAVGLCHFTLGGPIVRAMWLMQALKEDYDVTLITTGGFCLHTLNGQYGTSIAQGDIRVRVPSAATLPLGLRASMLRAALYERYCRRVAHEYDVLISPCNFTDFGRVGIQFVADCNWTTATREELGLAQAAPGFLHRDHLLRRIYLGFSRVLCAPSGRDMLRQDLVLANSRWSAEIIRQYHGVDLEVVHPPVVSDLPRVSWESKRPDFVCIGRVAPEKRVEWIIEILNRVRKRGHDLRLHLIGPIGSDGYGRMIGDLCQQHSEWVIPQGPAFGTRKAELLTACRYGIHACVGEAFGIAVAEMAKAGCITFAPSIGGQTDILDHPALLYSGMDEAEEKIHQVLTNGDLQMEVREHLAVRGREFTTERFMERARHYVRQMLSH